MIPFAFVFDGSDVVDVVTLATRRTSYNGEPRRAHPPSTLLCQQYTTVPDTLSMSIITSGTPYLHSLVPAIHHRSRCILQCPSLHLARPASTHLFQQYTPFQIASSMAIIASGTPTYSSISSRVSILSVCICATKLGLSYTT